MDQRLGPAGSRSVVAAVTRLRCQRTELRITPHKRGTVAGFRMPLRREKPRWINARESQEEGDGEDLPEISQRRAQEKQHATPSCSLTSPCRSQL